jgi:stage III sporulation protein AD
MEAWMQICGGALLCTVAAVVLRQLGKDGGLPVQWVGILLLSCAGLALLQPVIAFAGELAAACGIGETTSLLLRGLGVAMVSHVCADFCRQSGEASIAQGVEMAGKAQILLLALPSMRELVSLAEQLLGHAS